MFTVLLNEVALLDVVRVVLCYGSSDVSLVSPSKALLLPSSVCVPSIGTVLPSRKARKVEAGVMQLRGLHKNVVRVLDSGVYAKITHGRKKWKKKTYWHTNERRDSLTEPKQSKSTITNGDCETSRASAVGCEPHRGGTTVCF